MQQPLSGKLVFFTIFRLALDINIMDFIIIAQLYN